MGRDLSGELDLGPDRCWMSQQDSVAHLNCLNRLFPFVGGVFFGNWNGGAEFNKSTI